MSRRRKRDRHRQGPAPPARRSTLPRLAIVALLVVGILASFGFWWKRTRPSPPPLTPGQTTPLSANSSGAGASNASATVTDAKADFQKLVGQWLRPDGGYVVEVRSVDADGRMDAAYFNPRSIHVERAEASREGSGMKVFIELRDVNYPGSTYTLAHDAEKDQLRGIYFQAVEREYYDVQFVRMK
jgi:hypothetical protein